MATTFFLLGESVVKRLSASFCSAIVSDSIVDFAAGPAVLVAVGPAVLDDILDAVLVAVMPAILEAVLKAVLVAVVTAVLDAVLVGFIVREGIVQS